MKREELLRERLKRYSASETAAFHMPGHKRHMEYGLLRDFPNPFSIDITEIDGFDNLHHPGNHHLLNLRRGFQTDQVYDHCRSQGANRNHGLVY